MTAYTECTWNMVNINTKMLKTDIFVEISARQNVFFFLLFDTRKQKFL